MTAKATSESTWQQEFDLYRSVARSTEPLSRRT